MNICRLIMLLCAGGVSANFYQLIYTTGAILSTDAKA